MNDEIKEALRRFNREDLIDDGYERDLDSNIEVFLTIKQMIYYNQLQSNWNSLREELKKHKDILNARWQQFASHKNQNKDILNRFESKIEEIDFILDKMNELEGNDK